ncbi:hypothetical protein [Chitinolyticbacter meiyuanensis]|uniref:hypothetical protein n=1 Tax=Chitinolyticbacter meiyuanensis TaxID=682798 RepID=UPI0011E60783|nr:hypothetical protein [Chitinolyticbacter meiyuanensis]
MRFLKRAKLGQSRIDIDPPLFKTQQIAELRRQFSKWPARRNGAPLESLLDQALRDVVKDYVVFGPNKCWIWVSCGKGCI